MKQQVVRQVITAGSYKKITFGIGAVNNALVENFTGGDIYVYLGSEPANDDSSFLIKNGTHRLCNISLEIKESFDEIWIKTSSTGIVQVQGYV